MRWAAKLALVAGAFLIAVLACVHAASENGRAIFAPGSLGRSGLDAHIVGALVDGAFRAEALELQSKALLDGGPDLTREEVEALAADPVALERLLAGRRQLASQGRRESMEYPQLPSGLLELAQLSYAVDPLNAPTLRTIALGSTLHVDREQARQLMQNAAALSKRDEMINLWLAGDYGEQGQVSQMLGSFDHALRTSARARRAAIPLVVGQLGSSESQATLGRLLRQEPVWEPEFWNEFARNPVSLDNALSFFKNSGVSVSEMPERSRETLYLNLKRTGQYNTLFSLSSYDADQEKGVQSEGRFVAANGSDPLAWSLRSRGDFAARIHEATGELQIDARAGSFGVVADRIVRGNRDFQLSLRMAEPLDDNATLHVVAACVDGGRQEITRAVLRPGGKHLTTIVKARPCGFVSVEISIEVAEGRRNPLLRIATLDVHSL